MTTKWPITGSHSTHHKLYSFNSHKVQQVLIPTKLQMKNGET